METEKSIPAQATEEVVANPIPLNFLIQRRKKKKALTFVGTEPHPIETKQSILVSGHRSCASLMAKIVGLLATIAPSCQRLTSACDI